MKVNLFKQIPDLAVREPGLFFLLDVGSADSTLFMVGAER